MQLDSLQWPGLWNLPVAIVDYETNKVYDKDHPLPPHKSYLDSVGNRCIRLSAILELFSEEVREEAEWTLRQLQQSYDIGKAVHSTTSVGPKTGNTARKVTTYIPSVALMAFAILWPYCQGFQSMRDAMLEHLNNYSESVCMNCGFVQRDCKCSSGDKRRCSTQPAYLGSGVTLKDTGVQTEPMVVVGMQQKPSTPAGISVLVPQTVRMPSFTVGQPSCLAVPSGGTLNPPGVDVNTLTPGIINLPPTIAFPGYPPTLLNPVAPASIQPRVSVLCPSVLGAAAVTGPSSLPVDVPTSTGPGAMLKRKLDTDESVVDASVQTTGKSYVKKMKLRMGDFSASDFRIIIKDTDISKKQTSSRAVNDSSPVTHGAGKKNTETLGSASASPNMSAIDMAKKGLETPIEKKYTSVWKLLEDSEDDESTVDKSASNVDSEATSACATTEKSSVTSDAVVDVAGPSCNGLVLLAEASQLDSAKPDGQTRAPFVPKTSPVEQPEGVLADGDVAMDEEGIEGKLVIDTNSQPSQHETKSVAAQHGNDWAFRNGMKDGVLAENEKDESEDVEMLAAVSESKTKDVDVNPDRGKSGPLDGIGEQSGLADLPAPKSVSDAAGSTEAEPSISAGHTAAAATQELAAKPRRVYGKFEYTPTGEHILRCLVPKCSQTFDTKLTADIHNHVHPGFMPGVEGSDGPTYLQCHCCEFQAPFYHWYDLLRHLCQKHQISLVDSSTELTCEYCGLGFETKEVLVEHIDFHYSNRYKCIYCGLLLLTWGQVQRHLDKCQEKSKRSIGVNLGCPFCTFVFHKRNIRNLHLLSHVDKGLACALCDNGVIWSDWKTLRKHYQQKHAKAMLDKISPFGSDLPHRQPPLRCTRSGCDVTFKTFALFSNHMCRAHDLVPYTLIECVQCERRFRTEKSHEWHVKHMHGEERLCDQCDFVASSKAMLKLHVSQKHQEKQHTCTECDKSFLYYHQLRIHMAHHARRSIYPCRQCDLEFTRHADLRAHLKQDHQGSAADGESEEKPSGHSCPECDFHAASRSAVVQHVRRVHPEVADGPMDADEDDADHSYFNTKLDLPPQRSLSPPSVPSRRPPTHVPRGLGSSRRGRRRHLTSPAVNYYSRAERYVTVVDRRERRNQQRQEKEFEARVKQLRRLTCARSRSIDEHRTMGRGRILSPRQNSESADDGTEVSGIADPVTSSPSHDTYPYLDHSYFSLKAGSDGLPASWKSALGRPGLAAAAATDVSAFQECETMLLGLPSSRRGVGGRRGRGGRGRGGWTTAVRRASLSPAYTGDDVDSIDPTIRDLDLLAESELLLRPAGDYSILQDILGPNCMSTSQLTAASTRLNQVTSPMKLPSSLSSRVPREHTQTRPASDAALNDSLSLDDTSAAGPSDLDDIELCEDDYRLFDPHAADTQTVSVSANTAAVSRPWKTDLNGGHSGTGVVQQFTTDAQEKDVDSEENNSAAVYQPATVSADDYDDETCSATSEPACTSFSTDPGVNTSAQDDVSADDVDASMDTADADSSQ